MLRKMFVLMVVFFRIQPFLFSQPADTINENEARRIIHYLAGDSLKGRGNFTSAALEAGLFIADEFKRYGLQPLAGFPYHAIPFRPYGGPVLDHLVWNGSKLPARQFIYLHANPGSYGEKTVADFSVVRVDGFFEKDLLEKIPDDSTSLLLWTDRPPEGKHLFPETLNVPTGGLERDLLLVYADKPPGMLSLTAFASPYLMTAYNIVGILPGRTKPDEMILFSAHYDHMGVSGKKGDTILNGANDNASGTTALLMLVQYFSKRNDNERTLVFCAFAGEELGLFGSQYLAAMIDTRKIIAGINLEMLGVPQYGKNRVFIVGERYSNLPELLRKQFRSNKISIEPEPDESKKLFQRSDNYPFALKGVPYHTIMASDDDDGCYHKPCDEIKRIDVANMTRIIKAIAASANILVNGRVKPWRINPEAVKVKQL
jgi:hypothetical protein